MEIVPLETHGIVFLARGLKCSKNARWHVKGRRYADNGKTLNHAVQSCPELIPFVPVS